MLYSKKRIQNTLSFDIETVALVGSLNELGPTQKEVWMYRYHNTYSKKALEEKERYEASGREWLIDETNADHIFLKYAPLVPEYSKVIAVSFGKVNFENGIQKDFETIACADEKELLMQVAVVFDALKDMELAGYNILSYDIPFLFKRYVINNIAIPKSINFLGKKPWEIKALDIALDWKGSGYNIIAFETMLAGLGMETSKNGAVNGMEISHKYHNGECNLKDIKKYVEEDESRNLDILIKFTY